MHRINKPKVILIPVSRLQKLTFISKLVKLKSEHWSGELALAAYNNSDEIKPMLQELGATDYFLIDKERFISYVNLHDPDLMKKMKKGLADKRIKFDTAHNAKKEDFMIYDVTYDTYWTLV